MAGMHSLVCLSHYLFCWEEVPESLWLGRIRGAWKCV